MTLMTNENRVTTIRYKSNYIYYPAMNKYLNENTAVEENIKGISIPVTTS